MRIAYVEIEDGTALKCSCPDEMAIHEGDRCVVKDDSILEFGRVARLLDDDDVPEDARLPVLLRRATLQDQSKAQENALYLKMTSDTCRQKAESHKLGIRIVSIRISFDRKVVIICYTAEERVQFKEMVKELAAELHARIEMHQIGIRDAAKMIGGMGPCGRELCCSSWLNSFEGVTVRMAKNQHLSLNPGIIGGCCGRLKCCLRYENSCYSELDKQLPREGSFVESPDGKGRVIARDLLKQKVKLRFEDSHISEFKACELGHGAAGCPRRAKDKNE